MLARFRKLIRPPIFPDPDKTRYAQNINTILLVVLGIVAIYLIYPITQQSVPQAAGGLFAAVVLIGMLFLLRRGHVQLAGILLSTLLWIVVVINMTAFGGIRNSGFSTIMIVIIIASLTLGIRAGVIYAAMSILAAIALAIAESLGILPPYAYEPAPTILVSYSLTIIVIALLLFLSLREITAASKKAIENERVQKEINIRLVESQSSLESRNIMLERRNVALQTIAEAARISILARDENTLLNEMTIILANRLGFNHVGIFLTNDPGDWAALRAASSQQGKVLIKDQYQIRIVAGELEPTQPFKENPYKYRIAGQTYQLEPPIAMPGCSINNSVPLIAGSRLIGLMNVQRTSTELDGEDQTMLQAIAGQIATSLDNIRLFARLQTQLHEINLLAGQAVEQAWGNIRAGQAIGYQYDQIQVIPSGEQYSPEVLEQLLKGKSVSYIATGEKPIARLIAPISLREQIIGVIGYENNDPEHVWQDDEALMLETIATRVGLALENARLLDDARRRADHEKTISDITSKMSASIQMENILRTTAEEIGQIFQGTEVLIQIQPKATPEERGRTK